MDIGFEILIPAEAAIPMVGFERPYYEWQGVKYPQDQELATVYYFKLRKTDVPGHILALLPESFQNIKWQCISIIEGLEELSEELEDDTEEKGAKLLHLLHLVIGNEIKWVVNFEPNYDSAVNVTEGDIELAFKKIVESLKAERSGFVIWCYKG
jgi:hypothetical protein